MTLERPTSHTGILQSGLAALCAGPSSITDKEHHLVSIDVFEACECASRFALRCVSRCVSRFPFDVCIVEERKGKKSSQAVGVGRHELSRKQRTRCRERAT